MWVSARQLGAGSAGHLADLGRQGVIAGDGGDGRGVAQARDRPHRRMREDLVDQQVAAARRLDQRRAGRGYRRSAPSAVRRRAARSHRPARPAGGRPVPPRPRSRRSVSGAPGAISSTAKPKPSRLGRRSKARRCARSGSQARLECRHVSARSRAVRRPAAAAAGPDASRRPRPARDRRHGRNAGG